MIDTNKSPLLLDWSRQQTRPFGSPVKILRPEDLYAEASYLDRASNIPAQYPSSIKRHPFPDNNNFMPQIAVSGEIGLFVSPDLVDVALFRHIRDFIRQTPEMDLSLTPDNLQSLQEKVTTDTHALCTYLSRSPDKFFPGSLSLKHRNKDEPCGTIVIDASEALSANDFIPNILSHGTACKKDLATNSATDLSELDTDFKLVLIWHEFAHSLTSQEYLADLLGSRTVKVVTQNNAALNLVSDGRALSAILEQTELEFYKYGWACVEAIDHTIASPVHSLKEGRVPHPGKWINRRPLFTGEKFNAVKKIRGHLEHAIGKAPLSAPLIELEEASLQIAKTYPLPHLQKTILARFTLAARRLQNGYVAYFKQTAEPVQIRNALMLTR